MPATKHAPASLAIFCTRSSRLAIVAAVMLSSAALAVELPTAPPVVLTGLLPDSAEAIGAAAAQQQQEPDNALTNGNLAMQLHAHDRSQLASAYYARARALDDNAFRWAYLHGLCLEELGDAAGAVAAFRRATTLDPDYVPAVLKLAGLLLASGNDDESGKLIRRVVKSHPERADTQYNWGRWLLRTGRTADSIGPLEDALRINGDFAEGHYVLAQALRETGAAEQALRHQAQFEQHRKSKLTVRDPERQALNALNTTDRPSLLRARELVQARRYDEALAHFVRAADINPARITTHTNLVMLYGRKGDVDNAQKHYQAAMAIDPDDPQLHFQYGNLMLAQQAFEKASSHFERSLLADPGFANAWAQLGAAREAQGDMSASAEAYRMTLESDPNHRQANYHYGRQLALQEGAYSQAIEHLERALEPEDRTTVMVLHAMAGIYAVQNRFDDAVASLERARGLSRQYGAPPGLAARIDAELARFYALLKN